MITESSKPIKGRLLKRVQMVLLIASCAMAAGFFNNKLSGDLNFFLTEFQNQNEKILAAGDIGQVSKSLEMISKSARIYCIVGDIAGKVFFENKRGACAESFFQKRGEIRQSGNNVTITFFYGLPPTDLQWLAIFLLLQAGIAILIFRSQTQDQKNHRELQTNLAAMARQVAHDIRSPLAALSMLDKEGQQITANHERLRKDALGRLKNLVTSLLGEEKQEVNEPIGDWIGSLVEEKQIEFKDNRVTIGAVWSTDIKSVILPGDSYMWRRVVSNLVNNAVEACKGEQGSVAIEAERCAEGISLAILDNGGGIPPEVMRKLGQRGFTYGKEGGFGLGVFGAKEFVESLGGQLQIVSQSTGGTKVRLVVPPIAQTIVLIEDDVKLAELWKISAEKRGIQVRHFDKPESFLQQKASVTKDTPIYLDLSFPDTKLNALDFGQALRQEGYAELFVCSGQDRRELSKIRWAKGICGKEPPWL